MAASAGAQQKKEPESFFSVLGKIFTLLSILCGVFMGTLSIFSPLSRNFNAGTNALSGLVGGGKVGEAAAVGMLQLGIADQIRRTEPKK
ncbi:MAG: hypothetical protein LBO78_00065 [Rickettsiales bacterium]|jgi:hypothetical protein|nr:hypothetical protein [Rickettsiales bacterium]